MKLSVTTPDGRHLFGVYAIHHVRLSFSNGHVETVRLTSFTINSTNFKWTYAPGQNEFFFPQLSTLVTLFVLKTTYGFGIVPLPESEWRS